MPRPLPARITFGQKLGLSKKYATLLAKLRTPEAIQDLVTSLPTNFEPDGDTCWSAEETLRQGKAHCIEGAFVAAAGLWINGHPPLMMDFQAKGDDDHVVTLFKHGKCWGAISKSNHVWLRWRDPIYRSLRELAMSYFHEYVIDGKKTLRNHSGALDLRKFKPSHWVTGRENCWVVNDALDSIRHMPLISEQQAKKLRRRDEMERKAGKMIEYAAPDADQALRY